MFGLMLVKTHKLKLEVARDIYAMNIHSYGIIAQAEIDSRDQEIAELKKQLEGKRK